MSVLSLIIYSSLSWAVSPKANNFEAYKAQIVCETLCYQDGDELGVIINKQCYCANRRDTSLIVQRVLTKPQGNKTDYPQVRY